MVKITQGFVGKIPDQSDPSVSDFFACPECGHDQTRMVLGHSGEGLTITLQVFAECLKCGYVFPAPDRTTNPNSGKNETSYLSFRRHVSFKLQSIASTRPQRRRLEKAIKANRTPEILDAASEIAPEVKEVILDAQRLGWWQQGYRFVLRYLKFGAALALAGTVSATAAYFTDAVLDALESDTAIEQIVDQLIYEPDSTTDQDPDPQSDSVGNKKEHDRPKITIREPIDI